ncbi:MAG: hypothetical protein H6624_10650 [Bdellovibrionaceae bacterium]|nr:hypothetical protein [Bdellovibrionales bacterium]MCB9084795.1 hypothetical protein [Pseudobdellovibrionaceae bacterium]
MCIEMRWTLLFALVLLVGCSGEEKLQNENSDSQIDLLSVLPNLPTCKSVESMEKFVGGCSLIKDSFERNQIKGGGNVDWYAAVRDDGEEGVEAAVTIEDKADVGVVPDGSKAVLFMSQDDKLAHDTYLISQPMNLNVFHHLVFVVSYLPVRLEQKVTLAINKRDTPEGLRIEICPHDSATCGLGATPVPAALQSTTVWETIWQEPSEFGTNVVLGNHAAKDWITRQVQIDVAKFEDKKNAAIFRLSVSMDSGFVGDNPSGEVEDAFLLDHIRVYGLKSVNSLEEAAGVATRYAGSQGN